MARSPFAKSDETKPTNPDTASPPPVGAMGGLAAFIGEGADFEGKLTFTDRVRIEGRFQGEIQGSATLVVGPTGEIDATVEARRVEVSGSIAGDVKAEEKLVLHKTARIRGDVVAGALAIEDGARLEGRVTMGTPPRANAPAKPTAPQAPKAAPPAPAPNAKPGGDPSGN